MLLHQINIKRTNSTFLKPQPVAGSPLVNKQADRGDEDRNKRERGRGEDSY